MSCLKGMDDDVHTGVGKRGGVELDDDECVVMVPAVVDSERSDEGQ